MEYFFVNKQKHKLSDQSVRFMINRYADLAGIEQHITPPYVPTTPLLLCCWNRMSTSAIFRKCLDTVLSARQKSIPMCPALSRKDILVNKHPRKFYGGLNKGINTQLLNIGKNRKKTTIRRVSFMIEYAGLNGRNQLVNDLADKFENPNSFQCHVYTCPMRTR